MPGTLTIMGASAGLSSGQKTIGPATMTGNATVGAILDATLASGDNTFSVPTGATAVAIFLGTGSTTTIKVRTNLDAADAGIQVGGSGFVAFPLPAGSTQVVLNASGVLAGVELSFI